MKKFYCFALPAKSAFLKKIITVIIVLFPSLLHAEIYQVTLSNYSACGGATLIPFCYYSTSNITPVTVYYEILGGANTWSIETSQNFNSKTSYVMYNGDDLVVPTTFRVRAVDEVTGQTYISNSVSVDPSKWNIGRGTALSIPTAYWGTTCGNNNYIDVANYYTTQGRPPFMIAYKRSFENDFINAGETVNNFTIAGIEPNIKYDIRVTDKCGMVSYSNASLEMTGSYTINQVAATCTNGQVTINPSTDYRYNGIAPYTYAVFKLNSHPADTGFTSNNVFKNLGPGTYEYYIKDACGHLSNYATLSLGNGMPSGVATIAVKPNDSCFQNITFMPDADKGTKPFTYGLRYVFDTVFTYQNDSVFTVSKDRPGTYYGIIISACGDTSARFQTFMASNFVKIDSLGYLSNTCVRDVVVHVSGSYGPYQYALYNSDSGRFIFQTSDTLRNLTPNINSVKAKDRCGKEVEAYYPHGSFCSLRILFGDYESKNSQQGCANFSGNKWIDVPDDNGSLIYSINPNNNTLNNVCWGVHVEQNNGTIRTDTLNGVPSYFLDRNFYIEPTANITLTDSVSVRIYITRQELNDMLDALGNMGIPSSIDDLKILKKKGNTGSPVDLDVTNDANANNSQFTVIYPSIKPFGDDWYMEFKVGSFSEFNPYMGEFSVLPLKLISFTATKEKVGVELKWTTTDEVNAKSFDVQWSSNGSNFKNAGSVIANNKPGLNYYSFKDYNAANATNYYRLKQIDKDGRFTYSSIVRVDYNSLSNVSVSPNPATDKLTIKLPQNVVYKSINIYDVTGRLVINKIIPMATLQTDVDISQLKNGTYILKIYGDKMEKLMFIKQ